MEENEVYHKLVMLVESDVETISDIKYWFEAGGRSKELQLWGRALTNLPIVKHQIVRLQETNSTSAGRI